MTITRRLARPLLASVFVTAGVDALRNPGPRATLAEPVTSAAASVLPIPADTEMLVKLNAGVQVGAGVLLATGRFPRLAACALAASLVPTTAAGHRFWEESDPARRKQQQVQFFKNLSMLGGLILAAVDTEGAPSLTWRAKQAIESTTAATADALSRVTP
ncbi:MAG: DoxX family protein [Acidimicrobiales bacterium]